MTLNTGLRLICLLGISLWTTITLAQDMSSWSDKTVCRLAEQKGTTEYIDEAKRRKLGCASVSFNLQPVILETTAKSRSVPRSIDYRPFQPHRYIAYNNQIKLSWLGYSMKALDGESSTASWSALSTFYDKYGIQSQNMDLNTNHDLLNDIFAKKIQLKSQWMIADSFEELAIKKYNSEGISRAAIRRKNAGLTKINGDPALFLNSMPGEIDHGTNEKYIKDRIELSVNLDNDLNGKTIWYGYKVRFPEGKKDINAEAITISQMKQMHFNRGQKKQSCNGPHGLFWRMNIEQGNRMSMWSNLEQSKSHKKWLYNVLSDEKWSTFKVGIHYNTQDHGWIRAYHNGERVFGYDGRTILNRNINCSPNSPWENRQRIGVYRGSEQGRNIEKHKLGDTLVFDNYILHWDESAVDDFIN